MTASSSYISDHITPAVSLHDKRILLVDDQRSFQVMLKAMLQNIGISRINIVSSAEEARRRCQKDDYDIYLIDYNLGSGENGRQLLEYLRQQKLIAQESIVFIISGDSSRAMVLSALESEPDGYLMKPFSQEQLRLRLQRALHRRLQLLPMFKALEQQAYDEVIEQGQILLAQDSQYSTFCRCLMAEMYLHKQAPEQARALLEAGLEHNESAWIRLAIGKACFQLEAYDDAILHLNKALHLRPLMVEAYRWLAAAHQATNSATEALELLTRAIDISPQSSMLQRQLADMALKANDYLHARDASAALLDLYRYDQHLCPMLLGTYIHCLILYAQHSADPYHIGNLQKQVNNALARYRGLLVDSELDYPAFEQVCQARVQIARGEVIKGKKMIYKAWQPYQEEPGKMTMSLLTSLVLGLNQLGEFEAVDQLQQQLPEALTEDPLIQTCLLTLDGDSLQQERQQRYRQLNEQGIQAYTSGLFDDALNYFREALKRAPSNTNAAINKAQALLQLAKQGQQNTELLEECRTTLALLDGVPLSTVQQDRLNKMREELRIL